MYYSSSPTSYTSSYNVSSFTPSYPASYTTSTATPYVTRDSYTEITVPTTTTASVISSSEPLSNPSLSWENFVLIHIELDRMASQIQQLQSEKEGLKIKAQKETTVSIENIQLQQELAKANKQAADLKTELKKVPELESRLAQITAQLSEKTKENESWRVKYDEMNNTAQRYSNLHESIRKENEKVNTELEKLAADFQTLKVQTTQLNSKLTAVTQARDKLNTVITDREKEIKSLKSQVRVLENIKAELRQTEQEKKLFEGLWKDTQGLIEQLRKEMTNIVTELTQGEDEESFKDLENDIEGFKEAVGKLKVIRMKVDLLFREKTELSFSLKERESELAQFKTENKQLLKQSEEKQKEVERMKIQVSTMASELNKYRQDHERLENVLSEKTMEKNLLEVQMKDLVDRINLRGNKDAYREKQDQLQREQEENALRIKEKRIEAAQKKLNQLATEKGRLAVTNTLLGEGISGKTKRKGSSKINTLISTSFIESRASVTPKSSKAALGVSIKKGFAEYSLEEELTRKTPTGSESARDETSKEKMTAIYQVAVEKDKQISALTQKIVKYEQQIKELNEQRMVVLAENAKLRESVKLSDLSKSFTIEPKNTKVEQETENLVSEKVKKMEEVLLRVREIEVELSVVIVEAKVIMMAHENEEINKLLGQKIYAIDEWKVKLIELDRLFTALRETTKDNIKETKTDSNTLKKSYLLIPGLFSPKTPNKDRFNGKVPYVNVSIEALATSGDSSPLFDSRQY